jgi:hypothetical protein
MSLVTEEVRVAIETERKFEFYIVGAIFTILGLAVHTAQPYEQPARNLVTICAFVALVVSAVCAVVALSMLMKRHWVIADMQGWEAGLQVLRGIQAQGATQVNVQGQAQPQPIADQVNRFETNKGREEVKSRSARRIIDALRFIRIWTFLLGLILLLSAKLWPIFQHLPALS